MNLLPPKKITHRHIICLLSFCLLFGVIQPVNGQNSLSSTGNQATGASGKVSYTVGQPFVLEMTGSNGSSINGMQQPFSIYTLGIDKGISVVEVTVSPNPVKKILKISLGDNIKGIPEFELYDIQGKLIQKGLINEKTTLLDMEGFTASSFILKIWNKKKLLNSFKIVKN